MKGEHQWQRSNGSPPRAWGQSFASLRRATPERFTPTGVGTMIRSRRHNTCISVHPHGRGDNLSRSGTASACGGSPPRAWGQSLRCSARRCCTRFTPTGVGTIGRALHLKTKARFTPTGVGTIGSSRYVACAIPVHPHGRGDNTCVSGILMRFASKHKPRSHVPHQDGILTRKSPSTCMS